MNEWMKHIPQPYLICCCRLCILYLCYILNWNANQTQSPHSNTGPHFSRGFFLTSLGENNFCFIHFHLTCIILVVASTTSCLMLCGFKLPVIFFLSTLLMCNLHVIYYSHCKFTIWCVSQPTTSQSDIGYCHHHREFCHTHAVSFPLPHNFLHQKMTNLVSILSAYFACFRAWANHII